MFERCALKVIYLIRTNFWVICTAKILCSNLGFTYGILEKLTDAELVKKLPSFMVPEFSSSLSQKPLHWFITLASQI